jgi:hypothetical protein
MNSIWKYDLNPGANGIFEIEMPSGAKILTVQAQYDKPKIWAIVNTSPQWIKVKRRFLVLATGELVDEENLADTLHKYIGTFQLEGGMLVFHVFELFGKDKR